MLQLNPDTFKYCDFLTILIHNLWIKIYFVSHKLRTHLVAVGVALGGDMAMYSDDPPAAVGMALDTSEEYWVPPSMTSPGLASGSPTTIGPAWL